MFAVETILPGILQKNYHYSSWQIGLTYLGAGVGNALGSVVGGYLSDRLLLRSRQRRGRAVVEDRLTVNLWMAGFVILPLGLLLFGWMAEYSLSVWGPIVGFGIQCFGMNQITTAIAAYLVDAMPGQGASVSAAANVVRGTIACILAVVANPTIAAVGPGWTMTSLVVLNWFAMSILVILLLFGERLRRWSGYPV
ncbi:hypothetical protein DFQ28_011367 [Apophysomyces sp. BC1034]|nr:hypothetical protein DFQ30_011187 [Apophysomyces sp. BC1015]KAG0169228.1 hypothetical protein DFQ29_009784 [Apophysomyces sp. BC1021]KAG0184334.1 hypothetical protein DFQ28_011367 [Apophysomyces sp. BC1034]